MKRSESRLEAENYNSSQPLKLCCSYFFLVILVPRQGSFVIAVILVVIYTNSRAFVDLRCVHWVAHCFDESFLPTKEDTVKTYIKSHLSESIVEESSKELGIMLLFKTIFKIIFVVYSWTVGT